MSLLSDIVRNQRGAQSRAAPAAETHLSVPAARSCPGSANSLSLREQRAQGMPGADAPAALRVRIENTQVSHHRFTGSIRPSLRDGFNGFLRDLLGEPGLLSPSQAAMRKHRCPLDISVGISGPHDFAVRVSAVRLEAPKRPPHPASNVRDDRETPLMWARDVADSAGDLGARSTATDWHDGQITCHALTACQGNAHPGMTMVTCSTLARRAIQ